MVNLEIIKIASDTENFGVIEKCTHFSKLKNSICGDEMKIYLIVDNGIISNFKYQCQSCIYCQASVSLLSKNAKNKSVEEVKKFVQQADNSFEKNESFFSTGWKEFNRIMTKNNIARKECLLLPLKTVINALNKKIK